MLWNLNVCLLCSGSPTITSRRPEGRYITALANGWMGLLKSESAFYDNVSHFQMNTSRNNKAFVFCFVVLCSRALTFPRYYEHCKPKQVCNFIQGDTFHFHFQESQRVWAWIRGRMQYEWNFKTLSHPWMLAPHLCQIDLDWRWWLFKYDWRSSYDLMLPTVCPKVQKQLAVCWRLTG